MTAFDLLHPAVAHHVVNSLGWRELRPFQEAVIEPLLAGEHLLVLAPTAGGKTEAAFLPALSRMLAENWSGLGMLYICPIKALLNNLETRLQRYSTLVGRRTALWHGDVPTKDRREILREPPDCLLTTPESLEVMLVSPRIDAAKLFGQLQLVIVDEVHAFAGDDRGWHLLSVLSRIARLAGREFQRVGLSATVGNPDQLLEWLVGGTPSPRRVCAPAATTVVPADVQLDYVGSLANAAQVIALLHRGQKRLVFVDSRAGAEELGLELRQRGVTAFVTHSSLSHDQRRTAEEAFASRDDCVIVATSVLELGIDVGDLDRVIQIDAPYTVASFLQRMGRTGRRAGAPRNCLFLATQDEALIRGAALLDLWSAGYIEPIEPPRQPYHVLAQQILALILQHGGMGRSAWHTELALVPALSEMAHSATETVVEHMLARQILWEEEGILGIGPEGERLYGQRNFMDILSVFLSAPLFTVLHGRRELGFVDQMTFYGRRDGPQVLLLGGRAWRVNHVDWSRKLAYVEPTEAPGRSRWWGAGRGVSFALAQAIRVVLASDETRPCWSQRATERLREVRNGYSWLRGDATVLLPDRDGTLSWWTFAGAGGNAGLASALSERLGRPARLDDFRIGFERGAEVGAVQSAIEALRAGEERDFAPDIDESAIQGIKFADCLPISLAQRTLQARLQDAASAAHVLEQGLHVVHDVR